MPDRISSASQPLPEVFSLIKTYHVVNAESLAEHHRFQAVQEQVTNLVKSRRKYAGRELVALLHEGPDTKAVMETLTTGMVNNRDGSGAGICLSFAEMCVQRKRPDILRAVIEAGAPKWLRDIESFDNDPQMPKEVAAEVRHLQFIALGFRLPTLETRSDWMRALTTFQVTSDSDLYEKSLFMLATEKVNDQTQAFLAIALEVDPQHPDIEALAQTKPEAHALIVEMRMRAVIGASTEAKAAITPPLRRRAAI